MSTLVSQMTKEELIQIIESAVERKLIELLAEGELKSEVHDRLIRQREMVAQGERGRTFQDIVQELDLG